MSNKAILCVDDEQIILTSLRDQLFNHFGNHYICVPCHYTPSCYPSSTLAWRIVRTGISG